VIKINNYIRFIRKNEKDFNEKQFFINPDKYNKLEYYPVGWLTYDLQSKSIKSQFHPNGQHQCGKIKWHTSDDCSKKIYKKCNGRKTNIYEMFCYFLKQRAEEVYNVILRREKLKNLEILVGNEDKPF